MLISEKALVDGARETWSGVVLSSKNNSLGGDLVVASFVFRTKT